MGREDKQRGGEKGTEGERKGGKEKLEGHCSYFIFKNHLDSSQNCTRRGNFNSEVPPSDWPIDKAFSKCWELTWKHTPLHDYSIIFPFSPTLSISSPFAPLPTRETPGIFSARPRSLWMVWIKSITGTGSGNDTELSALQVPRHTAFLKMESGCYRGKPILKDIGTHVLSISHSVGLDHGVEAYGGKLSVWGFSW